MAKLRKEGKSIIPIYKNNNHRRSIRIKEYDYSKAGMYFITICTQNRRKILSKIENLQDEDINNCRGKALSLPLQDIDE